ncbi:hypothetical protein [Vampirovibrio sp.]|uniref:hypothetical protein n=1 Tax=Vampirovibrio sp. TaxID=2717857 RepID=UPI003592EEC2
MSNFNEEAILEQANQLVYSRLQNYGLTPEEVEGYAQFVASFNSVAISELAKEPGIQLQEDADPIPLDDATASQTVSLFGEGVLYSILRCREHNIGNELAEQLTQQVAMHIYEQAKQVVAATHGQEHTPEFQFNHEQQVEFITQGAESALVHYIDEYEKAYGPIHPEPELELSAAESSETPQTELMGNEPESSAGITPPMPPTGAPNTPLKNHEKYAAVSLMLTTLTASQRAKLLHNFNPAEKELIAFYSYPQHVEQHLDIDQVEAHLKKLKALFNKRARKSSQASSQRITALIGLISAQKLLSCVKEERAVVKRYLMAHHPELASQLEQDSSLTQTVPPLSPRLAEIIYHHLAKRLDPERQQRLSNEGSQSR